MEKAEKVKEGRAELLMGEKLKRRAFVGKRDGYSTPSFTWKFGAIQPDGTLIQDSTISPNSNTGLSARKLGANLWELQQQQQHEINHMMPSLGIQRREKICNSLNEDSSGQPTSSIHLKELVPASPTQYDLQFTNIGQSLSPRSYHSSTEMPLHKAVVIKGKSMESNPGVKTSTELLKVLNRICSLEEKHALDKSLVKMLRRELDESGAQIQELLQEKERDRKEIERLTRQMSEHKVARKKEQDRIRDAVKLVEVELKVRRNWEKLHHELAQELSETKSLFTDALRDLERERKARKLLEDLCDEFAQGIRDYEKQVRFLKNKSCEDQSGMDGNDGLILHMSEAWLDERKQTTLTHSHDVPEKQSTVDRLCIDIETFLRAKQSGDYRENGAKHTSESNALVHSLESFHLNEPASAPWKGDSVGISASARSSQLCRGMSLTDGNDLIKQLGEIGFDGLDRESARSRKVMKTVETRKDSDLCRSFREGRNRMTSRHPGVSPGDPDIFGGGWRRSKSIKVTTLKTRLMEARQSGKEGRIM